MHTKSHPPNDGFLARETERLELLKATYSLRADGTIFRDRGDGWKRVVLLTTVTPEAYWSKIKSKDATLSREFKAYRAAVIDAVPLCDRPEYFTMVDLLGDDVDGIWSHMDEIGKRVEIETLVELNDLDNARRDVISKATNMKTMKTIQIRCRAFAGDRIKINRISVDGDGLVRVWDPVAGHFTRCHSLTSRSIGKIASAMAENNSLMPIGYCPPALR